MARSQCRQSSTRRASSTRSATSSTRTTSTASPTCTRSTVTGACRITGRARCPRCRSTTQRATASRRDTERLRQAGGFDEELVEFGEVDTGRRVRAAGGTVWAEPAAVVHTDQDSLIELEDVEVFSARWDPEAIERSRRALHGRLECGRGRGGRVRRVRQRLQQPARGAAASVPARVDSRPRSQGARARDPRAKGDALAQAARRGRTSGTS